MGQAPNVSAVQQTSEERPLEAFATPMLYSLKNCCDTTALMALAEGGVKASNGWIVTVFLSSDWSNQAWYTPQFL
jgi:hypothetical protein